MTGLAFDVIFWFGIGLLAVAVALFGTALLDWWRNRYDQQAPVPDMLEWVPPWARDDREARR